MIISHVKIIAFQTIINIACGYFILVENTYSLYNKQKIYKCLEITVLFLRCLTACCKLGYEAVGTRNANTTCFRISTVLSP